MNNSLREKVTEYIVRKFKSKPENLWARYAEFAVLGIPKIKNGLQF